MIKGLITRFLPSLIPGLGMFANPWIWIILGALIAAGFVAGAKVEGWHRDSAEKAADQAWMKQYVSDISRYRTSADLTRAALAMQAKLTQDAETKWKLEKSRNAKPLATCTAAPAAKPGDPPAAAGAPVVMLTPEFIGLYNGALAIGLREAGDPGGTDGAPGGPGSVTPDDVLDNVKDNAKLCNGFRKIITEWQALARRNGWVP